MSHHDEDGRAVASLAAAALAFGGILRPVGNDPKAARVKTIRDKQRLEAAAKKRERKRRQRQRQANKRK